jgi:predicted enzyme related to lactoylglutathione lyase
MSSSWYSVAVDCEDPTRLAAFWAEVLGYRTVDEGDGVISLAGETNGPWLEFVAVPEGKTVKNRLHIDLNPDDQDREVERLLASGASRADVGQGGDVSWVVMADPEGNEFCVLTPR